MYDKICMFIAFNLIPKRIAYWSQIKLHTEAWQAAGTKVPEELTIFDTMKHQYPPHGA